MHGVEMSIETNVENLQSCSSDFDSLFNYLKKKGRNHNNYKSYSSIGRVVDIRDSKKLYLSTGYDWNDISDRNRFNSDDYGVLHFGKCFSYSTDESVAMWMLYGGIDKRSGMIDFTKKGMQGILSIPQIEFGYSDGDRGFVVEKTLTSDSFDLYCVDIVYYKARQNAYYIKRSDEHGSLDPSIFNRLSICKKAYPWQYEKECRLVCSVDKKLLSNDCYVARIDLDGLDLGKSLEKTYHGPNFPSIDTYNTLPSSLDNSIDWSLCDGPCDKLGNAEE